MTPSTVSVTSWTEDAVSTDKRVTTDLIETLEDGRKGFQHAADRLTESEHGDLADTFRKFSAQRALLAAELEKMAASYGDDIDEDGSVAAAVHRGWMSFKDIISGSDASGVLDAAVQGEEHAVSEFTDALDQDISQDLRVVVQRQFAEVANVCSEVRSLRNRLR